MYDRERERGKRGRERAWVLMHGRLMSGSAVLLPSSFLFFFCILHLLSLEFHVGLDVSIRTHGVSTLLAYSSNWHSSLSLTCHSRIPPLPRGLSLSLSLTYTSTIQAHSQVPRTPQPTLIFKSLIHKKLV